MMGLIHSCTIQRRYVRQRLTFSAGAGTPAAGQTVTGADSEQTAVIVRTGNGYLIVEAGGAAFTPGEAISTPTWSATLSAQADNVNQSGEPEHHWTDDQASVPCRFYHARTGKGAYVHEAGEAEGMQLKCMLPSSVTIAAHDYRITTSAPGFAGTYAVSPYPVGSATGIHHYEAMLQEVL